MLHQRTSIDLTDEQETIIVKGHTLTNSVPLFDTKQYIYVTTCSAWQLAVYFAI